MQTHFRSMTVPQFLSSKMDLSVISILSMIRTCILYGYFKHFNAIAVEVTTWPPVKRRVMRATTSGSSSWRRVGARGFPATKPSRVAQAMAPCDTPSVPWCHWEHVALPEFYRVLKSWWLSAGYHGVTSFFGGSIPFSVEYSNSFLGAWIF